MGDLTLATIGEGIGILVAIIGGGGVLYKKLKKWLGALFTEQMSVIETEIKELKTKIEISDMQSCKNFLVRCLADVERGEPMSETEKERFYEQYEHYRRNDGNSYIKQKVENLQKEGKL